MFLHQLYCDQYKYDIWEPKEKDNKQNINKTYLQGEITLYHPKLYLMLHFAP